jgi:hypothetical protein
MKRLSLLTILLLLTACASAPGQGAVETAIAQTQAARPNPTAVHQTVVAVVQGTLGVEFGGHAPTESAAATGTPTPAPVGGSRSNPAPAGTPVTLGDYTVLVGDAVRPADAAIEAENMFNTKAPDGSEYLLVRVEITCNLGPDEKSKRYVPNEFKLITPAGNVIEAAQVAGDNLFSLEEQYGGSTIKKLLAFVVSKQDAEFVMSFEPIGSKAQIAYIQLDVTNVQ